MNKWTCDKCYRTVEVETHHCECARLLIHRTAASEFAMKTAPEQEVMLDIDRVSS